MNIRQILYSKLANIYQGDLRRYLVEIRPLVEPYIPDMVHAFYEQIREVEELSHFMNNPQVEQRLRHGLALWLQDLLQDKTNLEAYIDQVIQLGTRHADLNINLHYVHHGLRILKREFTTCLDTSDHNREWVLEAVSVVDELMEIAFSLMSDSYFESLVKHQSNLLSMRMQAMGNNLAMACMRMRGVLADWARDTLNFLFSEEAQPPETAPFLQYSEFGLWLEHKGEMYLPEDSSLDILRNHIQQIDINLSQAATHRHEGRNRRFRLQLRQLNERINQACWYLETLVEQAEMVDSGRDALTSVFNRRYLETVLRRETEISNRQGFPFAVALLDLDHFKRVNDTHGHAAGDAVLRQFAELLVSGVRSSDFVFRYGGEEFLLLLVNVRAESAQRICEKLRLRCSQTAFTLDDQETLTMTCSIGLALFDGHPDFRYLVKKADQALYAAKQGGRNQLMLAKS